MARMDSRRTGANGGRYFSKGSDTIQQTQFPKIAVIMKFYPAFRDPWKRLFTVRMIPVVSIAVSGVFPGPLTRIPRPQLPATPPS